MTWKKLDEPRPAGWYRVYRQAFNAIGRCTNEMYARYDDYGRRGIRATFSDVYAFTDYLLTLPGCFDKSLVLDRIDNDGHYAPGNLRYVTKSDSMKNRRRSRPVVDQGTKWASARASAGKTQCDVARETGICRMTVRKFEGTREGRISESARIKLTAYYERLQ